MAKIYGQLEKAALEVSASDLSGTITGLMSWNSTSGQMKVSDGTNVRAILRNDLKAIIGNNGTDNNNIRFHRGAASVLQFLQGGDATAEGTLSVNLAQTSGRVENYANASLPAVGNAGRIAWVSDLLTLKVDNGSSWIGVGDVYGPASSTDNALVRFDSTTGKLIQNSGATLDDSNILSTVGLLLTGLTASRALQTDASKNLESSTVTSTELGYLSGVTSAIQTQFNAIKLTPTASKTSNYSAVNGDLVLCNSSGGTFAVTLPTATAGHRVGIKKTDSSFTTVSITGTVDGVSGSSVDTQNEILVLVANGTDWETESRRIPSNWIAYTPTISAWSTNTTTTGFWRRVGDSIEVQFLISLSGAPTGNLSTVTLPTGLTASSSKMIAPSTSFYFPFPMTMRDNGAGTYHGICYPNAASNLVSVYYLDAAVQGGQINATAPFTWASGDTIAATLRTPITGWRG